MQDPYVYDTFSEAYLAMLRLVHDHGEWVEGTTKPEKLEGDYTDLLERDEYYYNRESTREMFNVQFTIREPALDTVLETKCERRNKIIRDYHAKEVPLYDAGDDVNLKNISKVWRTIQNPDGTVNANYGLMTYHIHDAHNAKYDPETKLSQWEWAKERLLIEKNTRQAYLHYNRPMHQWRGNLDQPCTMHIQFYIRNNKLYLKGVMRSNDLVYGTPYNILYFIKLMYRMRDELREAKYPDLEIGDYIHSVTSLHYYKRNEKSVKEMLGLVYEVDEAPLVCAIC